jgi:hypothetical protein
MLLHQGVDRPDDTGTPVYGSDALGDANGMLPMPLPVTVHTGIADTMV